MVHSLYQSLNNLETIYADRIGIRYYDEAKGGVVEAAINPVADADIFHSPATVHDQIQFLRCLLLSMAYFKFSGACNIFILLQHISSGR